VDALHQEGGLSHPSRAPRVSTLGAFGVFGGMTPADIRRVLRKYDTEIEAETRRFEATNSPFTDALNQLCHVRWMCQEIPKFLPDPYCACGAPSCDSCHPPPRETPADLEKAMRWLGFIQGVLWSTGTRSIDEMREDNRAPGGQG